MNPLKQARKLLKLQTKADIATTSKQAAKILKKARKVELKMDNEQAS